MSKYMKPEQAAEELGISRSTITRCKKLGAPVHYVGTCGRLYQIDPEEFSEWMNAQGQKDAIVKASKLTVLELRAKRKALCG